MRIDGATGMLERVTPDAMSAVTSPARGHAPSGSTPNALLRSILANGGSSDFMRPRSQNSPRISSLPSGALPWKTTRIDMMPSVARIFPSLAVSTWPTTIT